MAASFGRTEPRYDRCRSVTISRGTSSPVPGQSRTPPGLICALRWDRNPADRAAQLLTRQVGRAWAADDITDAELQGESAFGHRPH